jgi:hypothetical protein
MITLLADVAAKPLGAISSRRPGFFLLPWKKIVFASLGQEGFKQGERRWA